MTDAPVTAVAPSTALAAWSPSRCAALEKALDVLVELYDPPAVFVFGSSVKQLDTPLSDIDLLVRMQSRSRRSDRGGLFYDVLAGSTPRFDLACFTDAEIYAQLANPYSFLSSVLKTAVPVRVRDPDREPLLALQRPHEGRGGAAAGGC